MTRATHIIDMMPESKKSSSQKLALIEEIEASPKVVECKRKVCDILLFGLQMLNEHRVDDFLAEYKTMVDSMDKDINSIVTKISQLNPETTGAIPGEKKNAEEVPNTEALATISQVYSNMNSIIDKVRAKTSRIDMDKSEVIFRILVELIHYKDHALKSAAVRLLTGLYNQTKTLGMTVFNTQIIDERKAKENYAKACEFSFTLDTISDTIEKWYYDPKSTEINHLAGILNKIYASLLNNRRGTDEIDEPSRDPENRDYGSGLRESTPFKGRVQNKVTATMLELKSQPNMTDIHQYQIDSYEERVDTFEQNLYRNTGIFHSLLKMIEFDAETEKEDRRSDESTNIMRKIYRILAKAGKDNEKNKEEIGKYLDTVVLRHFQLKNVDLNSGFLIREVIINNKSVLLNENRVRKIAGILCGSAEEQKQENMQKCYVLSILSEMVKYKDFILVKNQNAVLALVISKDYHNLRVAFDSTELETELWQKARNKMLSKNLRVVKGKKILVIPPEVCYVLAYLQLLTLCAEGKNAFSENICQNLMNLETLYKFMFVGDYAIVVKHAMLLFFYHVYLDTEREIPFHILEVFLGIVKSMLDQFELYSKKKFAESEDNVESVEDFMILLHNSYQPFNKWVEDYLCLLIQCFVNVIRRNLNLITDSEPARDYEKLISGLIDSIQVALEKFPNEAITSKLIRLVREIYAKNSVGPIAEKIKEKHRMALDPKANAAVARADLQVPDKARALKRKQTVTPGRLQTYTTTNYSSFRKSEMIIEHYFASKEFSLKCGEEFTQIVRDIVKIDSNANMHQAGFTTDGLFRSLMKFLDPVDNQDTVEKIYIDALQTFRKYIETPPNVVEEIPMTEWEINYWKYRCSEVVPKQNRFVALGLIPLISNILHNVASPDIIQETLLLAISVLYGGNPNAQRAFLEVFSEDPDSLVLERLKTVLSESFEYIRKNMREQNTLALKMFYIKFDTASNQREVLEAEIEKSRALLSIRKEIERVGENYRICKFIFKFLELLCEGHNNQLQNLLRQQNVGSAVSVQKSANFISLTSGIWGSFIKFVNPDCVDLGSAILDFTIESTQGPCELNQKEFYHNKVIDFSKDFMNDFSSDRDFEARGFKGKEKDQLNQLITKTIRMLNALLEANQDKAIYDYLGINIDPAYLLKKLVANFHETFPNVDLQKAHTVISPDTLLKMIDVQKYEELFSESFEVYFFLQNVEDSTGLYKKHLKDLRGLQKLVFEFFKRNSRQIEIIFRNSIQKVYFMIHPTCRYFDENQKKLFLDNVKRDTPNDKITDFMMQAPMMFDRMDHISRLKAKVSFISEGSLAKLRDACFLVVLIINLYIFFTFKKGVDHMRFVTKSNSFTPIFLQIMGILHMAMSFFMIVMWLFLNGKLVLMEGWRDRFTRYKKMLPSVSHSVKSSRNKS